VKSSTHVRTQDVVKEVLTEWDATRALLPASTMRSFHIACMLWSVAERCLPFQHIDVRIHINGRLEDGRPQQGAVVVAVGSG